MRLCLADHVFSWEEFEMSMTLTDKEADEFYEWFLDMYGRKRHAAEIAESKMRGFERGFEQGFEQGFERGRKKRIALNMLKKKYSLDEISEITDLSEEEILQIAKDNKLVIS